MVVSHRLAHSYRQMEEAAEALPEEMAAQVAAEATVKAEMALMAVGVALAAPSRALLAVMEVLMAAEVVAPETSFKAQQEA